MNVVDWTDCPNGKECHGMFTHLLGSVQRKIIFDITYEGVKDGWVLSDRRSGHKAYRWSANFANPIQEMMLKAKSLLSDESVAPSTVQVKGVNKTIRELANQAWNDLNAVQSILRNALYGPEQARLIDGAKKMCDAIVRSDASDVPVDKLADPAPSNPSRPPSESPEQPMEVANPVATMRVMYRNYWSGRSLTYANMIHDLNDKGLCQVTELEELFRGARITDGDEIEITVRKTGNRPFGKRVWRLLKACTYGPVDDPEKPTVLQVDPEELDERNISS